MTSDRSAMIVRVLVDVDGGCRRPGSAEWERDWKVLVQWFVPSLAIHLPVSGNFVTWLESHLSHL